VNGNLAVSGTSNLESLATFNSGFISNASSTQIGNWRVDGNATTTGSQYIASDLTVNGISNLTGDTSITGDLTVTGSGQFNNVTTTDSLAVGGKADITGNLTVSGLSDFQNNIFNSLGDLSVDDNLTISGTATTTQQAYFGSTLRIAGNSQVFTGASSIITETNDLTLNPASNLILNPETGTIQFQNIVQANSNIYSTAGLILNYASTTSLAIQNGSGTNVFVVDTTNAGIITTGNATTTGSQNIDGDLQVDGTTNLTSLVTLENGFISNASSTQIGDWRVDGNATTTGHFGNFNS